MLRLQLEVATKSQLLAHMAADRLIVRTYLLGISGRLSFAKSLHWTALKQSACAAAASRVHRLMMLVAYPFDFVKRATWMSFFSNAAAVIPGDRRRRDVLPHKSHVARPASSDPPCLFSTQGLQVCVCFKLALVVPTTALREGADRWTSGASQSESQSFQSIDVKPFLYRFCIIWFRVSLRHEHIRSHGRTRQARRGWGKWGPAASAGAGPNKPSRGKVLQFYWTIVFLFCVFVLTFSFLLRKSIYRFFLLSKALRIRGIVSKIIIGHACFSSGNGAVWGPRPS